ncbi:MAG: hypothetical protein JRJ54_08480, partial [Deltaproteobacteria bacterium]|nr:hypothetical protein [Deltaproteobacteria bacterium]
SKVFCPDCSDGIEVSAENRVWDNGWVLELDMERVRENALIMGTLPDSVTAEWVFDEGFATWVGITPDDAQTRDRERNQFQKLAQTDVRAYVQAMRDWGVAREKRFTKQGWRKMKPRSAVVQ